MTFTPASLNPLEREFFTTGQPKETRLQMRPDAPVGAYPTGSSEWWLQRLLRQLAVQQVRMAPYRTYYRGENETWNLADQTHKDTFGDRFKNMRANLAKTVVDVVEQRMTVIGIDLWDDPDGSDQAWEMWQQNSLDDLSSEAHLEMLSTGMCPVFVDPWEDVAPGIPLITIEDPLGVVIEHHPADHRRRLAALKRWTEDDGRRTAILYLPDRIEWWRTDAKVEEDGKPPTWRPVEGEGGPNPLEVVPMVAIPNAPRAEAEHAQILSHLDDIAGTLYQMVTAGHYMSYPQRWATGADATEEDTELSADGTPLTSPPAGVRAGPDQAVTAESPDARFGSFEVSDLQPFITKINALQELIGTETSTPHRLLLRSSKSVPSSGEAIRLEDLPLTRKVRRKHTKAGNGWETVMRLAFLRRGDAVRSRRMDMETAWEDPEEHTEAEHVDALVKMQAMGVPQEELWRRLGATPQQIRRWRTMPAPMTTEPEPEEAFDA